MKTAPAALFLLDVSLLLGIGLVLGRALRHLGQPPVIAEILAGIVLGPSVLGTAAPDLFAELFPAEVMSFFSAVGGVGVVFFVFLVALEMDLTGLHRDWRQVASISTGALIIPFVAGVVISFPLYQTHMHVEGERLPQGPFVLFIATVMAVTAFPVLARILSDHDLIRSRLGLYALSAAGLVDLVGWILLTVVLVSLTGGETLDLVKAIGGLLLLIVLLTTVLMPTLNRALDRMAEAGRGEGEQLAGIACVLFACAGFTYLIGLHSVLGALLFGLALTPRRRPQDVDLITRQLWPMTAAVLLPIYFAGIGLTIDLSALNNGDLLLLLGITSVACCSKWIGGAAGARFAGLGWRDSAAIGALMNTRGLVELIFLNIGWSAGLLDDTLFAILTVVALIATFTTSPLLSRLRPRSRQAFWEGRPSPAPTPTPAASTAQG